MMVPSERAIALFLSQTSSTRNRALLYIGITDGNVDDAVALFNSKPDETFRAAISRPVAQFRRPLANGAKGYEDKYGVIHLETSTDDESEGGNEVVGALTGGYEQSEVRNSGENVHWGRDNRLSQIHEPKITRPTIEHPPPGAPTSGQSKSSGTMRHSMSVITKNGGMKNRRAADRDSSFEPENSPSFNQTHRTDRGGFPQLGHRGRYARELGIPRFGSIRGADSTKPISARTRTSIKKVGRLPKTDQSFRIRPRKNLRSAKKQGTGIYSLCQPADLMIKLTSHIQKVAPLSPTPRTRALNFIIPITPIRCSARGQSSEDDEAYVTPPNTPQSRFKQAKKNTSGVVNPRTPRAALSSNALETKSYPTPLSVPSSRLKTGKMTFNTSNPQQPSGEILHSSFHRASFENISPLAMKSDHYIKGKTHHHQRDSSEIPLKDLYNSNKSKTNRHQRDSSEIPLKDLYNSNKSKTNRHYHQRDASEIPLKDMYLAPTSIVSTFSLLAATNYAHAKKRWLLINIQSATMPACGILNRDIWRHPNIANIVNQSFIFLQLNHSDARAEAYFGKYYGVKYVHEESEGMLCAGNHHKIIQLPHIALVDPVSGRRWKIWNGPGLPDKDRFLADLSEYEMVGEGEWCEWGTGVIGERD
ncbi:hypothetical protein MMC31_005119 [Peltigera leucophlebia]|nr:hypothetical protein [Peltigera leucophlebia]